METPTQLLTPCPNQSQKSHRAQKATRRGLYGHENEPSEPESTIYARQLLAREGGGAGSRLSEMRELTCTAVLCLGWFCDGLFNSFVER